MKDAAAARMVDETAVALDEKLIDVSPWNPRQYFDPQALEELRDDILQNGLIHAVVCRPSPNARGRYELVVGERRLRAVRLGGLPQIQAFVRDYTDLEVKEVQLAENDKRKDVNALEEAISYKNLRDEGLTIDEIAGRIKKSTRHVYGRLKLLDLVPEARELYLRKLIDTSVLLVLARLPATVQAAGAEAIAEHGPDSEDPWSFKDACDYLQEDLMKSLDEEQWSVDDTTLFPSAGPCTLCPKRGANIPELATRKQFENVCTDVFCLQNKRAEHVDRVKLDARKHGITFIEGAQVAALFPDWMGPGQTAYATGWIPLSHTNHNVVPPAKYSELLQRAGLRPHAYAVQEKYGHVVGLLEQKRIAEIDKQLKAAGIEMRDAPVDNKPKRVNSTPAPTRPGSASHKQQEEEKRRPKAARVMVALSEAVEIDANHDKLALRTVMSEMEDFGLDFDVKPALRRRGVASIADAGKLDERELLSVLVESTLVCVLENHLVYEESLPSHVAELLAAYKVDLVELTKDETPPEAPTAKGKKTKGKKTAPPAKKGKAEKTQAKAKAPAVKKPAKKSTPKTTKKGR